MRKLLALSSTVVTITLSAQAHRIDENAAVDTVNQPRNDRGPDATVSRNRTSPDPRRIYCEILMRIAPARSGKGNPDGSSVLRESASGADAVALGEQVAGSLLSRGGRQILQEVYGKNFAIPEQP